MKKIFFAIILACLSAPLWAGVTTYTFTSVKWASKVDATVCDGVTDGWKCDKEASEYSAGRLDAEKRLYSCGVGVKTGTTGAGATSVVAFEDVRRITVNFCQNSGKGKGTFFFQVGDNEPQSIVVNKPAKSGEGVYNRDSIVLFDTPQSGKIKFWVNCTENGIYINTISIRSSSGGSSPFTMDTYQLVTDVEQLQDSDQVIFGVYKEGVNYIMGYYDEWESVNNIHAIKGRYSADRSMVEPDESAIYTLRMADLNGHSCYIFQDELRYEEAYLVASGGQTKNRLAVWNDVVSEKSYGNYGFWDIRIENGGEAVITNLGNSLAKIIQYNASNNPTLFACYADRSQTPVCLYRRVEATGDIPAIIAPFINFGTTIERSGTRTIAINANRLSADISVSLTHGEVFSLSANTLDRDGDNLTVSYTDVEPGHYVDTITFVSGEVRTQVAVLLNVQQVVSIAQAVTSEDHTIIYLNDVVVTKKYDNYIYVRDETGSMLLFDRGDGITGKRFGQGLKSGDPLSGVTGRYINYYGVPEISPSEQCTIDTNTEIEPEQAPQIIESTDVCRYLVLYNTVVNGWSDLTYNGRTYALSNKFNLSSYIKNVPTRTTVIVSYDYDVVTLYIVAQETQPIPDEIEDICIKQAQQNRVILHNGLLYVKTENGLYTLTGERLEGE